MSKTGLPEAWRSMPTCSPVVEVRSASFAFWPRWKSATSGGVSADVDAVVAGERAEAAGEALADGPELPLAGVAVDLAEDHRRLGAGVLGEVVAGDLLAVVLVGDADVGVGDLAEVLVAGLGVVDRDGHRELVDLGRDARQVDVEDLVV